MQPEWTLNTFNLADTSPVLRPLNPEELWESVPLLATRRTLVVGVFPPLLQLERSFSAALNRTGLPALSLPPHQLQALPALLSVLPPATVVVTLSDYERTRSLLAAHTALEVVLAQNERPPQDPSVGYEVHTFPGLVACLQCEALIGTGKFHVTRRAPAAMVRAARAIACACGRTNTLSL